MSSRETLTPQMPHGSGSVLSSITTGVHIHKAIHLLLPGASSSFPARCRRVDTATQWGHGRDPWAHSSGL